MRFLPGLLLFLCLFSMSCHRYTDTDDARDREYNKAAEKLFLDRQNEAAISFLDSVYSSGHVSPLGRYITYSMKMQVQNRLHNYEKSILYADSAISTLRKNKVEHKYEKEYAHILLEKGHIFTELSKFDSAYKIYMDGYAFVYATGDTCYLHEFDYFVGMMRYRQNRGAEARKFFIRSFNKAMTCSGEQKPYFRMQELLSNIGLTYYNDSSIFYYDSCLSFIERNMSSFHSLEMGKEAKGVCLLNKAHSYQMLGDIPRAEQTTYEALAVYSSMDSVRFRPHVIRVRMMLATLYYYAKDTRKLRQIWSELEPLIDSTTEMPLRIAFSQFKHAMYESEKDYKRAYEALNDYVVFADSVQTGTHQTENADVLQAMKNKEQEYRIGLLTSEARLQRTFLWIFVSLSVLAVVIIVVVYTIYQRTRRRNKLISDQKTALEKSNREKNRILHVVAHDLRDPVSGAVFLAGNILEHEGGGAIDPLSGLKLMKNSLSGCLQLINELVAFARDGSHELLLEQVAIADVVHHVVALQQSKASEKGVRISVRSPKDDIVCRLDRNKVTRLLTNLLDNAIKFSKEGTETSVSVETEAGNIRITVRDAGIGIPPRLLPALFDMFTPSGRKGTNGEPSLGLGLSICRQIAELHGGSIMVESQEGQGTTFTVLLPIDL